MPSPASERAAIARAVHRGDREAEQAARQRYAEACIEAKIAETGAKSPALTAEQVERLQGLVATLGSAA